MSATSSASNLTQAQSLIWAGQQLHPDAPLYNMVLSFRIRGPIDRSAFAAAFRTLVATTDAMRTVFVAESGTPQRRTLDAAPAELEIVDATAEADPEAWFEEWSKREAAAPFDVSACSYRSVLVRLGDEDFVWWLSQHHLITDGWAAAVVYRRMADLYAAALAGELPGGTDIYPSFDAYAEYEQRFRTSPAFEEAAAYWETKAETPLEPLSFYGVGHDDRSTRTDRVTVHLGEERCRRIAAATAGSGAGLMGGMSHFTLFATSLVACLGRISGQRRLAILAPAHNRPSPRFKATAGLFIEVLPLYADIPPGATFRSLLEEVGGEAQQLVVNARPGTSSAAQNRDSSVLLNFINASFGDFAGMPMRSDWVHPGHGDSDHSLRLQVHDFDGTGNYVLHFDVKRDVFDEQREHDLIRHFLAILDAVVADPGKRIADVDLLTDRERAALTAYNDTETVVPAATVVETFQGRVAAAPHAPAIRHGDDELSYRQLDVASDALARRLARVAGPRPRVGIYLRRSIDMVVAVLGVLKTGGSYVPLDSQYPANRVGFVMEDGGAAALVTDFDLGARLAEIDVPTIALPLDEQEPESGEEAPPMPVPTDTAYVMYTSGSTGTPKGVEVTHGNLAHYVHWANREYGRGEPVSFPLYSSFGFDLTVTSLFVPLVSGGAVVVYPEPDGSDLSVRDVFTDDDVDVVKLTPSHLSLLEPELLDTKRIRTLILGGEDLKATVAHAAWQASSGRLEIVNEYGPTEATVGCMVHRFDPERERTGSVSLGRPVANTRIHVLDADLAPAPIGVVGELCVSGAGVARGYLGRPDLTAERFVPDPSEPGRRLYRTGDLARWSSPGEIEFLGRADEQVKIRGYRIELGEVEAALLRHPDISECVVGAVDTETERAAIATDVEHCVRCGLASNHPDALLDDAGVCEPCRFYDAYRHHAEAYFGTMEELRTIFPDDRRRNPASQDCVMLLSGGKDSTYALYQLVEFGLTPLVFSLDNGFISDGAKANIRRAVDDLGLELVMGTTTAMNDIFKDSLEQFSNVCQGCFKTVYTLGMSLAHERGLHHVVTGLSRGQIFETRLADLFRIGITARDEVDAAIIEARRAYHRVDDAVRRSLDTTIFDDDEVFDEIRIVDFYRYHDVGLSELYEFLEARAPWVRPADTGRSTNCLINNTGIYVHKKERRFHNYALPYSWDVRLGHKTRDAALAELDDEIDVVQVRGILDQVGYSIEPTDDRESGLRGPEKRLVGYYVATSDDMTPAHLRTALGSLIPEHMVPSYLVRLDSLPLTVNGKIDREALPDPRRHVASDDQHYVAPRTHEEETLVDVWEEVLGVDRIGVHDRFIELGGDSILNIQVVAKAKRRGLAFTPQQLFRHQTIAELAAVVETAPVPVTIGAPSPQGVVDRFTPEQFPEVDLSQEDLDDLLDTFGQAE